MIIYWVFGRKILYSHCFHQNELDLWIAKYSSQCENSQNIVSLDVEFYKKSFLFLSITIIKNLHKIWDGIKRLYLYIRFRKIYTPKKLIYTPYYLKLFNYISTTWLNWVYIMLGFFLNLILYIPNFWVFGKDNTQ